MLIKKLRIALTLAIFETTTLIILYFTRDLNLILTALSVGLIGSLAAILIHNLLSKRFNLMSVNGEKIKFRYSLSIFITIFLTVLFLSQNIVLYFIEFQNTVLGNFALGLLSAFIASSISLSFYNIQPFKIILKGKKDIIIKKTNVLNTSLLISFYEAVILPIMIPLMQINFALAGFASGLISGLLVTALYNNITVKVKWK
ncbi:hypothetical protein J4414_00400 [Candidatus Woesearchaeota archaeon]|nr:hypothetical protein [Candidatus Woesearchaeota archaeon]